MENFIKVLVISPNYKLRKGGIASVISLYSRYLKQNFNYSPSIYFQSVILSTILFPINLLVIILKLAFNESTKIVHIHGSHDGSFFRKYLIFLVSKKLFNKKVIFHLHSSNFHIFYENASSKTKLKIRDLINQSDAVIVLSEEWRDFILDNFKQKRIRILENIVEKQNKLNKRSNNDNLILLFLGRLGERKGIFDLLEVLSNMNELNKNAIELYIGGDGEVKRLEESIKDNNLKNVHFVGWVKDQQKDKLLNKCDVFVLPSYNEGLPISLLEAMSYGKPILSTETGGIPRILKNNVNGFLIEPGNKTQLQESILKYINKKELLETHGNEGLKIVSDYYPENVLSKLNNIYGEIL